MNLPLFLDPPAPRTPPSSGPRHGRALAASGEHTQRRGKHQCSHTESPTGIEEDLKQLGKQGKAPAIQSRTGKLAMTF